MKIEYISESATPTEDDIEDERVASIVDGYRTGNQLLDVLMLFPALALAVLFAARAGENALIAAATGALLVLGGFAARCWQVARREALRPRWVHESDGTWRLVFPHRLQ